jgi:hypothetical protein
MLTRRGLITGLISFLAAPAIVRASSLMDLRGVALTSCLHPSEPELPEIREVALGYIITRQKIEEMADGRRWLERLTRDGLAVTQHPNADVLAVTGAPDKVWASWRERHLHDKLA